MSTQQRQEQGGYESLVRDANDIPEEERLKEGGDDPHGEGVLGDFESVRPWRVAKSLEVLRHQINNMAPNRSKASDGSIGDSAHASRNSDHNPWIVEAGVGVVTARDITHDAAHGCDANILAEKIRQSRDPRVKYIIWNRRIAASSPIGGQPAWAWRAYTGKNGHTHHIHISVKSDDASYDSEKPWDI